MVDVGANLEIFAALSTLGVAVVLLGIAALSYARMRSPRALLVALAFLVLAIKGAYLTAQSWHTRGATDWILPMALLDLTLALLLYVAIRKA